MNDYEKEHLHRLRALLPECTVLLRKSGAFPLERPCRLALYGNGARHTVKGGTGSGEVNSRFFVTVEDGLKKAGFEIVSSSWLDAYDAVNVMAKKDFTDRALRCILHDPAGAVAKMMGAIIPEPEYCIPLFGEGDAAVYVLSRISGEGSDRLPEKGDVLLTDSERRDILRLAEKYGKFMLVINAGGPVDLSGLDSVKDILVLSQLGVETGSALADILLGHAYPSGKLATTWTPYIDYQTVGSFGDAEETEYCEGVYVGYRYFDCAEITPMFPFGFGLGYTEFELSDAAASNDGERITVTARVTNIGGFAGKEVVQLYVSAPQGRIDKPYQALAAFAKTRELLPGESETVTLSFSLSDLASYDTQNACYLLEKGLYVLRLGASSRDTRVVSCAGLDRDAVTRRVKNVFGHPGFDDWTPVARGDEAYAPDILISADDIPCADISYEHRAEISPEAAGLCDNELARMSVGHFAPGDLVQSIIGEAGTLVAGAAGESANGLVMADGPAGLRLSRQYVKTKNGAKAVGLTTPESLTILIPPFVLSIIKKLSGGTAKYRDTLCEQYATAIPIGTALAQSWNTSLCEVCGDIVGSEMDIFGVDLWLAPALNIHRSILCGRNFEYYSEDPLLSGKMAAAITRGVQWHPGRGVTVKHFAANNQEYRRYSNDSRVSERAMREIYLRGFELAVKEGVPLALMSSYNLINGVRTNEHAGLLTDILRCEWGFDGVVMTDWLISQEIMCKGSKHAVPQAWKIAAAGGGVTMPGSKADLRNIQNALKDGRLSRRTLEENATRLLSFKNRIQ